MRKKKTKKTKKRDAQRNRETTGPSVNRSGSCVAKQSHGAKTVPLAVLSCARFVHWPRRMDFESRLANSIIGRLRSQRRIATIKKIESAINFVSALSPEQTYRLSGPPGYLMPGSHIWCLRQALPGKHKPLWLGQLP